MRIRKAAGWLLAGLILLGVFTLAGCRREGPDGKLPTELTDVLPIGEKRPLEVVLGSPQGQTDSLADSKNIVVVFNQPMVPLKPVPTTEETGPMLIDPPVPGRFRWKGTATLVFEPTAPLAYGTRYTVTVPKGTKSWAEQSLASDFKFEFTTPVPELDSSTPTEGNDYVGPNDLIFLRFNQPMNPETATGYITLRAVNGDKAVNVPVKISAATPQDLIQEAKEINIQSGGGREGDEEELASPSPEASPSPPGPEILVVRPEQPLTTGTGFELTLKAGLKGRAGEAATTKDSKLKFRTFSALKCLADPSQSQDPGEGINIEFNNPVQGKALAAAMSITPKVEIPESYTKDGYYSNYHYLYLDLSPTTDYTITISKDLKDRFGNSLGKDVVLKRKTTHFTPSLSMPFGEGVLEAKGPARIPIGVLNLPWVKVKGGRLRADQVVPALTSDNLYSETNPFVPSGGFAKSTNETVKGPGQNDRFEERFIDVKGLLDGDGTGVIYLVANSNYEYARGTALVQVTNLGVTAKSSAENCLIAVSTLSDATSVEGAKVELRDAKNKVLWSGQTDNLGTVTAPGWAALGLKREEYSAPPMFVLVSKGSDLAFVRTNSYNGISPWDFHIDFEWDQFAREFAGQVFTERGLYRAGEKVQLKGTMRERRAGKWVLPELKAVHYEVKDSREESIASGDVDLNEFGALQQTVSLKSDAPTGTYEVAYYLPTGLAKELRWDTDRAVMRTTFRVEAFKPAQFEVTVKADRDKYVAGDKVHGEIKGWWLFGAPMAGDKVSWTARLEPAALPPKGFEGYDFGPGLELDEKTRDEVKKLKSDEGTLTDKGTLPVEVDLNGLTNLGGAHLLLEGTVVSSSRQRISGRTSVDVFRGEYQIGVRPKSSFVEAKKPVDLEVVAVTPPGDTLSGQNIKLELVRREWNSVRKAEPGGQYRWISEHMDTPIESKEVRTSTKAAQVQVNPPGPGYYLIKATGTDTRGNQLLTVSSFYAWGGGYVGWAREDSDIISLVADKKEYKPGDTARILVKSPYPKCRALITLERELIMERYVQELEGSAATIDIPIKADHLPNVFVSVVLLEGRIPDKGFDKDGLDLGKPSFKAGYVNLPVETGEKRLTVEVKTDKPNYRPGEEVKVELQVKNAAGQGARSEVSLSAADLGVLNLIGYQTPNYFDTFYGPRPLAVRTAESRVDVIGQRAYGTKGENQGGGGSDGLEYRQDFEYTAYWNPSIITDAEGKAQVSFKLPDNLTTFRLMATSQTASSDFGSGEAKVVVNKPLLMQPSLPGFARVGDDLTAGVVLHNNTEAPMSVNLKVESTGLELQGDGKKTVQLEAGKEQEVLFRFKAPKAATADLRFEASGGGYEDAVKFSFPVQSPLATESVATSGSTTEGVTNELVMPTKIVPGTGLLRLSLASTALVGLNNSIIYLLEYPYGCLEQRVSRLYPILVADKLVESMELEGFSKTGLKESVQSTLGELADYQHPSGGFRLWKGSNSDPNPYLTAYVLDTARLAQERGFKVDTKVIDRAAAYLKKFLDGDTPNFPYNQEEELASRAYGLYALARWQKGDAAYLNFLFDQRSHMPVMGKAYLLMAARETDAGKEQLSTLEKELLSKARVEAATVYFDESPKSQLGWLYGSTNQTTALVMEALMPTASFKPLAPKVVTWLMQARNTQGHWGNTKADASVMAALGAYFDAYENERPDFTVSVKLGGDTVMSEAFKGRQTAARSKVVPLTSPAAKLPLTFEKKGPGRLYYDTRLTYAPAGEVPARDEGIAVFKSISDRDGRRPTEFTAGETYKVTLAVVTPKTRRFVVVNDPVAAGFEIVQTNFETESSDMADMLKNSGLSGADYFGTFGHFEKYDNRVLLFADGLQGGEHTFEYLVRASLPGTYQLPSTKAEEMYHPEVFGTTAPRTVVIK